MAPTFDCSDPDARADGLASAARTVRASRLVVLPTDTVYGLGCDAFSASGVRNLLAAKNRGPDMPVPVLVGSWSTIDGLVMGVPKAARDLIEAFWPGGLSLVLPHAPSLAWDLGSTKGTVMLRMPLHPVALELLRDVGPMAVSSANISGSPPATTADGGAGPAGRQGRRLPGRRPVRRSGGEHHRRPDRPTPPASCARELVTTEQLEEVLGQEVPALGR